MSPIANLTQLNAFFLTHTHTHTQCLRDPYPFLTLLAHAHIYTHNSFQPKVAVFYIAINRQAVANICVGLAFSI